VIVVTERKRGAGYPKFAVRNREYTTAQGAGIFSCIDGVLFLLLFDAGSLVTLGLLSDTSDLLHTRNSGTQGNKQGQIALPVVGKKEAVQQRQKAA
jgi:hypothetical protein